MQVASREQSAAAPREILVPATVRDLARTSAGVAFGPGRTRAEGHRGAAAAVRGAGAGLMELRIQYAKTSDGDNDEQDG